MVGMPPPGWGHETGARCPVQADGVLDPPVFVELRPHQSVGVGGSGGDAQVEGNRVVAGGKGGREGGKEGGRED